MLARTADSLYWMNRYMERIDTILRVLLNGINASFDLGQSTVFDWNTALQIFSSKPAEEMDAIATNTNNTLRLLLTDDKHNSVKEMITKARENARGAQDHLTLEVWHAINTKYHSTINMDLETAILRGEQLDLILNQVKESIQYYGVFENTMPRQQGWNFMNLGRFIERSFQTLNFAEVKFKNLNYSEGESMHILYWKNMLLDLSGYELYLKAYRWGNHAENIIDMVFLNNTFPRSILYSVNKICLYLKNILRDNPNSNNTLIDKKAGMLVASVAYADLASIEKKGVVAFISDIKEQLYYLTNIIGQSYFLYY